jgi:hypothetical protein
MPAEEVGLKSREERLFEDVKVLGDRERRVTASDGDVPKRTKEGRARVLAEGRGDIQITLAQMSRGDDSW